jgi:hypothetical protein
VNFRPSPLLRVYVQLAAWGREAQESNTGEDAANIPGAIREDKANHPSKYLPCGQHNKEPDALQSAGEGMPTVEANDTPAEPGNPK